MKTQIGTKMCLAMFLTLMLVSAPILPAEPSAALGKISGRGMAEVNGTALPGEATLFSGDQISTRKESAVALSFGGGDQIFLPELSRARIERAGAGTRLALDFGALAAIRRSTNLPVVMAGGVRIEASGNTPAAFEVALNGTALKVFARLGSVRVTGANKTVEVPEGKTMEATTAAVPPTAPAAAAASGLSWLQTTAIVVGLAAGITGLGLGIAAVTRPNPKNCTISNSSPATLVCP
jgi:hypothetical protein